MELCEGSDTHSRSPQAQFDFSSETDRLGRISEHWLGRLAYDHYRLKALTDSLRRLVI